MSIELTHAQAQALASLTESDGRIALHQLVPAEGMAGKSDVFVTPYGSSTGYRIAADGSVTQIGAMLPAPR